MLYAELRNRNFGKELQINEVVLHDENVVQDVALKMNKGNILEKF